MTSSAELAAIKEALQHLALNDRARAIARLEQTTRVAANPASLAPWLAFAKRQPDAGPPETDLDLCLAGWQAYYTAAYEQAGAFFERAWARREGWGAWAALGAGKVCSDLGRFAEARDWLLVATALARSENDLYRSAECAGALGEVLCRAGYPRQAFELFALDAALLPPGSLDQDRLNNYRALCLSRLGLARQAEPLLWNSYYNAVDRDPVSAQFALASLLVMSVRHADEGLYRRLVRVKMPESPLQEMPWAYRFVVDAYWCGQNQDKAAALVALGNAIQHFARHYPLEQVWVSQLAQGFGAVQADLDPVALFSRRHPVPPEDPAKVSLMDRHLAQLNMTPFDFGDETAASQPRFDPWKRLDSFFI